MFQKPRKPDCYATMVLKSCEGRPCKSIKSDMVHSQRLSCFPVCLRSNTWTPPHVEAVHPLIEKQERCSVFSQFPIEGRALNRSVSCLRRSVPNVCQSFCLFVFVVSWSSNQTNRARGLVWWCQQSFLLPGNKNEREERPWISWIWLYQP